MRPALIVVYVVMLLFCEEEGRYRAAWIPAYAGMTGKGRGSRGGAPLRGCPLPEETFA